MTLRHLAPAPLLAVAIFACTPSVPSNPNTYVVTAAFDPTTGNFPLPSALAINPLLNPYVLHPRNAQDELLAYFYGQGGFPPDQVLPITFPIAALTVDGPNNVPSSAPDLDLGSIVPCTGLQAPGNCNLFVYDALGPAAVAFPALTTSYAKGTAQGTLSATPVSGGKPTTWRPGATYFYALRGGTKGIKTQAAVPLQPSSTMYTLLFGQPGDFTCPSTSPDCALKQLQQLQLLFQPIFAAVQNKAFPLEETVVVGAFTVAPATTWVIADPGAGVVPIPSNFLLDPLTNKVSTAVDKLLGLPMSSLDGFSTTGMDIAQTSGPIKAGSIRSSSAKGVYLYKAGATSASEVAGVYIQPPPITIDPSTGQPCAPVNAQGDFGPNCVTQVIGIQPALTVPTGGEPLVFPPLEDRTEYAVIVTKGVTDPAGIPLSNTTLGQMLLFTHPICSPSPACADPAAAATATSEISGVSGPLASLLESMRLRLQPVVSQVATDHGVARADIVMPYTFRTQTILSDALQLGAAPYAKIPGSSTDAFPDAPVGAVAITPAAMALKWGVPPSLLSAGISTFVEANVITFDKLDPATGAFNPVPAAGAYVPLPTIIAIPTGTPPVGGWPLVVVHHGLGRSRGDSLFIAQALAGNGMVVAALDAAKHGARAWCSRNTVTGVSSGCNTGVSCDTTVFAGQQGDDPTGKPGLCVNNALQLQPIGCNPASTPGCWDGTGGTSASSGSFVVTANLFRTRDTVRQDILDQSMLIRVLTSANGNEVIRAAAGLPAGTVPVDASRVFYVGQSWGAIEGTNDLAANPRVSRAVLNVGGATAIDILTTAPSFEPLYEGLLAALHLTPGTTNYLLFLISAKWIVDPADPSNFATHLVTSPLPNLLVDPSGHTPMAAKAILGQGARCDLTVPNAANELLYGLIGLGPLEPTASRSSPGMQWFMNSTGGTCPPTTTGPGASHGFLLDWNNPAMASRAQSNVVSYLLNAPVESTPVVVPAP
jgi:dienelactone hydrolase